MLVEKEVLNCPNCGGVVAKDLAVRKAKIRCPHCGTDLSISIQIQIIELNS